METIEGKPEGKCCCPCHKMPGVFVVLVGVAVLLRAWDVLGHRPFWTTVAILVILAGLQAIFRSKCKCCNAA